MGTAVIMTTRTPVQASSRSRNPVHESERGDAASILWTCLSHVGRFYTVGMERAVILFDNDCGFCRWSLSKILAWDRHGRLRPVGLQSPEADDLLKGMDPERKRSSWQLVARDGRTYSGGQAVAHLARLLPGGAPIAVLASAVPRTTDRAYRWVASTAIAWAEPSVSGPAQSIRPSRPRHLRCSRVAAGSLSRAQPRRSMSRMRVSEQHSRRSRRHLVADAQNPSCEQHPRDRQDPCCRVPHHRQDCRG